MLSKEVGSGLEAVDAGCGGQGAAGALSKEALPVVEDCLTTEANPTATATVEALPVGVEIPSATVTATATVEALPAEEANPTVTATATAEALPVGEERPVVVAKESETEEGEKTELNLTDMASLHGWHR